MSIDIQVFEETGAPTNGRGVITEIDNVNWMNNSNIALPYYSYPLRRPNLAQNQTLSYKKYIFFKISGTYTYIKNVKLKLSIENDLQADKTELFYKFTNVYAQPDNLYDGDMTFTNNQEIIWHPNLSTVSPLQATSRPIVLSNNQTYYTGYLATQMRVNASNWTDVGNTVEFGFKLTLQEFE